MALYRFCGQLTNIGEKKYDKFGGSVEFTDEQARNVILGGGCFIPAADFDGIRFTDQELSLYSNPLTHGGANAAFLAKKKQAQLVCHELRGQLEQPAASAAEVPAVDLPLTLDESEAA